MTARSTLFKSNRSQAVRLPKDVAFGDSVREVAVLKDGNRRIIVPANAVWDEFFNGPGTQISDRIQPEQQQRDTL